MRRPARRRRVWPRRPRTARANVRMPSPPPSSGTGAPCHCGSSGRRALCAPGRRGSAGRWPRVRDDRRGGVARVGSSQCAVRTERAHVHLGVVAGRADQRVLARETHTSAARAETARRRHAGGRAAGRAARPRRQLGASRREVAHVGLDGTVGRAGGKVRRLRDEGHVRAVRADRRCAGISQRRCSRPGRPPGWRARAYRPRDPGRTPGSASRLHRGGSWPWRRRRCARRSRRSTSWMQTRRSSCRQGSRSRGWSSPRPRRGGGHPPCCRCRRLRGWSRRR